MEGIDYAVLFKKNPSEDEIRVEIEEALMRLDETFAVTEFELVMDGRHATITFQAINGDGVEVGGSYNAN